MPGNGNIHMNKTLIFGHDLIAFHSDGAYFNDSVTFSMVKPGCFDIKKDKSVAVSQTSHFYSS